MPKVTREFYYYFKYGVMYAASFLLIGLFTIITMFRTVLAQEEASTNFIIRGDTLSSGSGSGSSSSFSLTADLNPFSDLSESSNFKHQLGYNPRIQANTPNAPLLENVTSTYYDRLRITIDPSGNPSDTLYVVIFSDDDFATFQYVQDDATLGASLGPEDYQDYTSWGGASGFTVIGLKQNTSYKARVKALNGDFTETGYGPSSLEVATEVPYVQLTVSENQVNFGVLSASSVSQTSGVNITVNTNATNGYQSYINGTGNAVSGGLYNGSSLIPSASTLLNPGTAGYGAQASSGTATVDAKYDLAGNNVGSLDLATSTLSSNSTEILGDETSVLFKATISATTEAGEYSDTVYFTISPSI